MTSSPWQLESPIDAVVFDCDGTLSTIEGIDELAKINGVSEPVEALTAQAMGRTGLNPALYQKRLDLVRPRREQVLAMGEEYFAHQVPDASAVIQLFKKLNKPVYLVSAGLDPAVKIFGEMLRIPSENIFAVAIHFDDQGNYRDYDHESPMTCSTGKRDIVTQIKKHYPNLAYIGDGLNDIAVLDLVARFVGFGGAYFRENIADLCHFYISALTLSPLLPLLLTQAEAGNLSADDIKLYAKGLLLMNQGGVLIK